MAKQYGTLQLLDTLKTIDKDNVFTYGEDRLYRHIRDLLAAHNRMTQDIFGLLVDPTVDNIRRAGNQPVSGEMIEVDEYGVPDVQKVSVVGYDVGFPLRNYAYALGWTKRYFDTKTVADIAKEYVAAQDADVKNLKRRVLQAFFRATNYTFIDRLTNSQSLPVKALMNADGTAVPYDEFANSFDGSTHTHLVGYASGAVAAADITALINNVKEHGVNGGQIVLMTNTAQEATVRGFTSNFDPLQAPLLDPGGGSTTDVVLAARENPYRIDDRPIGVWDGFVMVWTKPWIPANYYAAVLVGGTNDPIIEFRTRPNLNYGDYRLVAQFDNYPLRAQAFEREFGAGVWNRFAAAILYGGGTSYVQPTFA
jgi:hypothetical protein